MQNVCLGHVTKNLQVTSSPIIPRWDQLVKQKQQGPSVKCFKDGEGPGSYNTSHRAGGQHWCLMGTQFGVVSALSSWSVQSKRPDSARPLAPDFVYLNREAVKSGLVTSKELSQYRAQRGKARKQNPVPPKQKGGASQSLAVSDITFGVKTCR